MEPVVNILIWLHFIALALGVGGGMVMGMIGPAFARAEPAGKVALGGLRHSLFNAITAALLTLIVTGILILWLRYGGLGLMNWWFWAKMALVAVLVGFNAWSRLLLGKAESGDMSVVPLMGRNGRISGVVGLLVVLSAVFAFN